MRKVILYIAMSLDGYLADKNGGVDWLKGQEQDNQELGSYPDFIKNIDTVILGYNTYNQVVTELSKDYWPYSGMTSYVLTHKSLESTEEIIFTEENLKSLINKVKNEKGKDIWVCGGSSIVNQFIKLELIDVFHVTIIPHLIGEGIRLFENNDQKLKLISTNSYNGMTDLVYEKR